MKIYPTAALPLILVAVAVPNVTASLNDGAAGQMTWVATWATPISGVFKKTEFLPGTFPPNFPPAAIKMIMEAYRMQQTEFDFALPDGEGSNQTFRIIVRPDIWGTTMRVRFSNYFGNRKLSIGAASLALQEYGANLFPGTTAALTFSGKSSVTIRPQEWVTSDPVHLAFVTKANTQFLRGRNVAISFFVTGESGLLSVHESNVPSYISRRDGGDHTRDGDAAAFPYVSHSCFLVNELDVLADLGTAVVCALGDSITDEGGAEDGYDSWPDFLSRRLHNAYGDRVSIVNMGIGGNTVVTDPKGFPGATQPAVGRLDRDVLGISGLASVVWLEGINDLGIGRNSPEPVIEGYKQVVKRLHAKGIVVVAATVTPSFYPGPMDKEAPETQLMEWYGGRQTDEFRHRLNEFIKTPGMFDDVADMSRATEDPATGALLKEFDSGDHLHPNRAGHEAMAASVDLRILASGR